MTERIAVVRFLRSFAAEVTSPGHPTEVGRALELAAHHIEEGDHRSAEPDGAYLVIVRDGVELCSRLPDDAYRVVTGDTAEA